MEQIWHFGILDCLVSRVKQIGRVITAEQGEGY